MHWRSLAILAVSVPASPAAQADSTRAVVEGRVTDPVGTPLSQVEVSWQTDRRSALSRPDGSFSLVVPFRGETVILVRRPGYNAQVLRVDLSKGMWRGNIVLEPGSFRLPDVVVDAKYAKPAEYAGTTKYDEFFQRRKLGLGTFITRDQIEKMNAIQTIEILRGIPGIKVSVGQSEAPNQNSLKIARCTGLASKVTVWIDGQLIKPVTFNPSGRPVEGEDVAEMLSRITASGVEMVEVYRGAGQIPGQFHWDGCAAIVIWTRYNRGPEPTVAPPGPGGPREASK